MQADEEIACRTHDFMQFLELLCEVFVFADQRGQFQAEERDRLSGGTEHQPTDQRHADHQHIQRQMQQLGR